MSAKKRKWNRRVITTEDVFGVIMKFGAPSTKEIKMTLKTDSLSLRKPLGILLSQNKIFPMPYKRGVCWLEVTGEKGYPSIKARRHAAGTSGSLGQWKLSTKAHQEEESSYEEYLEAIAEYKEESGFDSYEDELAFNRADPDTNSEDSEVWLRKGWGVGEFHREPPKVGREAPSKTKPKDSGTEDGRVVDW